MIQAYKIMTGKDKIDREQFFQLEDSNYGLRGHSLKIQKDRPNLDLRKHFFSQWVVNVWNKLPQHVVVRQLFQEQARQALGRSEIIIGRTVYIISGEDMDVTSCIA